MQKAVLITFFSLAFLPQYAQLNNQMFEDRLAVEEADSGKLFLGINFLGFSKNNEYFDTIIEGYTLLGYQFNPFVSYNISKNVRLDAGAFFHKDFGNDDFSTVAPTLTLKITKRNMALLFGNLESSLNHRLIEPLYDFERVMNNRLETGVQLQAIKDGLFFDLWLDWQNMIYNKDPEQERFVSGISVNKRVINQAVALHLIGQALVSHRGGQINLNSPPLETVTNSAFGVEARREATGIVKAWTVSGFYSTYNNLSDGNERPYKDGSAIYFNVNASTKWGLDVMMNYWQGHEFISIQGGKVYPSISEFNNARQREVMKLIMWRALYHKQIVEGLTMGLRFEPYYDLGFKSFQYAYGFYLQFNNRFYLISRR